MQSKLTKKLNIRLTKKHVNQDLHADCYRYQYQAPYLQGCLKNGIMEAVLNKNMKRGTG